MREEQDHAKLLYKNAVAAFDLESVELRSKEKEIEDNLQISKDLQGQVPIMLLCLFVAKFVLDFVALMQIQQIKSASKNRLSAFHPKMPQFYAQVQQEKRFRMMPIGPIGMEIEVVEKKWVRAVESHLGRNLNNFIVCCHEDRKLLESIAKRENFPLTCSVQNCDNSRHVTGKLACRLSSVESVLKIQKDSVANSLIDGNQIDQSFLADNREEAVEALRQHQSIKAVYLVDGMKCSYKFGSFGFNPFRQGFAAKLGDTDPSSLEKLESRQKAADLAIKEHRVACQDTKLAYDKKREESRRGLHNLNSRKKYQALDAKASSYSLL